jgi:hypothetical protein
VGAEIGDGPDLGHSCFVIFSETGRKCFICFDRLLAEREPQPIDAKTAGGYAPAV